MAIKRKAGGRITGLAADTKPTAASEPLNTIFQETDTHNDYINNGSTWVLYRGPAKSESLTNKTIDTDVNTLKLPFCSVLVYKAGTTYKAKNMESGATLGTTSTTDASTVINAAIAGIPSGAARGFGGRVFIHAGDYICKTTISANRETLLYDGVAICGEGIGTRLIFENTSPLTNGIELRMLYGELRDCLVWDKNGTVTNLVAALGPNGVNGQYNWGVIDHVSFNGKYSGIPLRGANTIYPVANPQVVFPPAGETGLLILGNHSTSWFAANYKISNCEFFAFDRGCRVVGQYADMSNHNNIHMGSCDIGYELQGVQHNFSNIRIEGGGGSNANAVGTIGFWIRDPELAGFPGQYGAAIHMMSNINIELHKSDSIGILNDISSNNNMVSNLYNSSADDKSSHTWVDNNFTTAVNANREAMLLNIANSRSRYGQFNFGLNPRGGGDGIFAGNIKQQQDGVDTNFTTTGSVNGPYMSLITASAVNSVASVFYNNPAGNVITTQTLPSMYVRCLPASPVSQRIFIGLANHFAAPAASADILANKSGIGAYCDMGVSNNWKIMHNDGGPSSTIADFPTFALGDRTYGPTAISSGFVHSFGIRYNNNNPSANVRLYGLAYDYKTTEIPAVGTSLGFLIYIQNLAGGAARTLRLFDMEASLITV